jgi:2-polyprenyl-3-methyl-5-hydroxy-6-metoxy-1,4-benzoquinol methylase
MRSTAVALPEQDTLSAARKIVAGAKVDPASNLRMFNRLMPFIGARILEIGAGVGTFTERLLDRELIVASDKDPVCVEILKRRLRDHDHAHVQLLDLQKPKPLSLTGASLDTVICANRLEQVQNDQNALSFMFSILEPGGCMVLAVPASRHPRRYRKKTLLPKVRHAGFRVERAFYMNALGIAGSPLLDKFLAPLTDRLERLIPPPIGMSLIVVGRKPRYAMNLKRGG